MAAGGEIRASGGIFTASSLPRPLFTLLSKRTCLGVTVCCRGLRSQTSTLRLFAFFLKKINPPASRGESVLHGGCSGWSHILPLFHVTGGGKDGGVEKAKVQQSDFCWLCVRFKLKANREPCEVRTLTSRRSQPVAGSLSSFSSAKYDCLLSDSQ